MLASALDSFFANINASNVAANKYMSMRWRISDAIGSGANCLFDAIPSLRKFMTDGNESDWTDVPAIGSNQMGQRMKFMFCKLISAISCRSQPLVLVLDDLQVRDDHLIMRSLGCEKLLTYCFYVSLLSGLMKPHLV